MVCVNYLFDTPVSAALVCGIFALFYIMLMSYSPYLPPALIVSIIVTLFVYAVKGGEISCKRQNIRKIKHDECSSRFI